MKMKRIVIFIGLYAALALGVFAADFGISVTGESDTISQDEINTRTNIIPAPWVSAQFDKADLYASAGLNITIADKTIFTPELFRLEFSARPSSLLSFRLGRFNWQDASGLIARGRFDGLDVLFDLGKARLGVNALYTGFLYKDAEDINININPTDNIKKYEGIFDWSDFANTYFAPRRLLTSLYAEFPGFPPGRGTLYAGLTAQFDLSDAEEAFHTQYLLLRHVLIYYDFDFSAAGAAELENTKDNGVRSAFAFSLDGGYQLPFAVKNRLCLGLAWASGDGPYTAAFFPVTREAWSFVLQPSLSGIMIIRANYETRLLPSLTAKLAGSYFIRTDSTSFDMIHLGNTSYPLGLELATNVLWAPFSDIAFSVKGGVFLPKTGTAWTDEAPVMWRITAGTIISF